jgi:hypothetical protein
MAVSRALRSLLRIRDLEEEQRRVALESALVELHRLQHSLAASVERGRRGRELVTASANTGELPDRIAGIAETLLAARYAEVMTPRIASTELNVAELRLEFLAKRVERRQAETLIRETEARDAAEAGRRGQQGIDDWYSNKLQRNLKGSGPDDKT